MGETQATKANQDIMNRIHQMTAKKILDMIKKPECTPQELAQAIKFLKDNDVTADLEASPVLPQLAEAVVETQALPFAVEGEDVDSPEEVG